MGRTRASTVPLLLAVGAILVCYILGTPRSGGPDEPSHMVASAAVVRGQTAGQQVTEDPLVREFQVPAMVGEPNPGCWARLPDVPVGCASLTSSSTDLVSKVSSATDYAPWFYLLPGLASFVPSAVAYTFLARLLMALIPLILVTMSINRVRRVGPIAVAALILGLTPIAWFSMSIVNPSAISIAGGLTLWASLLSARPARTDLLLLAGWAGMVLARRDGPIWATLIVLTVCGALSTRPSTLWKAMTTAERAGVIGPTALAIATPLISAAESRNVLLALCPLGLVVADAFIGLWSRTRSLMQRIGLAIAAASATCVTVYIGVSNRPGGLEFDVVQRIVANTGRHLNQLVGVLGWLDAPVPVAAVYVFWIALGALGAAAIAEEQRIVVIALAAVATMILTSWILELGQGVDSGIYWQGRYSAPFFVGVPLLLTARSRHFKQSRSFVGLANWMLGASWLVMNAGFIASLHRWGAGVAGTWLPWNWTSWGAPLPPMLLIGVHLVASSWLVQAIRRDGSKCPTAGVTAA